MKSKFIKISIFFFACSMPTVWAQSVQKDSLKVPPPVSDTLSLKKWTPNPKTALKWAILPGGGQIYNRKWAYLKTPIVWGAMGTGTYFIVNNYQVWQRYKVAYYQAVNGLPNEFGSRVDPARIKIVRDANYLAYQQAIFTTALLYVLQGAEAFTAAHLMQFDLSDDLSMRIQPQIQPFGSGGLGIGISLHF